MPLETALTRANALMRAMLLGSALALWGCGDGGSEEEPLVCPAGQEAQDNRCVPVPTLDTVSELQAYVSSNFSNAQNNFMLNNPEQTCDVLAENAQGTLMCFSMDGSPYSMDRLKVGEVDMLVNVAQGQREETLASLQSVPPAPRISGLLEDYITNARYGEDVSAEFFVFHLEDEEVGLYDEEGEQVSTTSLCQDAQMPANVHRCTLNLPTANLEKGMRQLALDFGEGRVDDFATYFNPECDLANSPVCGDGYFEQRYEGSPLNLEVLLLEPKEVALETDMRLVGEGQSFEDGREFTKSENEHGDVIYKASLLVALGTASYHVVPYRTEGEAENAKDQPGIVLGTILVEGEEAVCPSGQTFSSTDFLCVDAYENCAVTNGQGRSMFDDAANGYGDCEVVSCNTNFHEEGGSCVSDTRTCAITNGQGEQTWTGSGYGTCQVISCDSGHTQSGNSCIVAPDPIDCQGSFSSWGSCEANGTSATQTRTYSITRSAQNGGDSCPYSDGQTQTQACTPEPLACTVFGGGTGEREWLGEGVGYDANCDTNIVCPEGRYYDDFTEACEDL